MDDYKQDMFNAIGLIGKPNKPKEIELIDNLRNRLKYIQRKLSNCLGYSEVEKKARYDEIFNTLEMIKEIYNVDL